MVFYQLVALRRFGTQLLFFRNSETKLMIRWDLAIHDGQALARKASHMFKTMKFRKQSVDYNQFCRFTLFAIRLKEHEITSCRQVVTEFISTLATHIPAQNRTSSQIGNSEN